MAKKKNNNNTYIAAAVVVVIIVVAVALLEMNSGPVASNYNQATPPPFPAEGSKEPVTPPVPPSPDQTVRFVIDSSLSYSVAIRNVGSDIIQTSQVGIYVNNQLRTCSWVSDVTTIPVGALRQCLFDGPPCTGGQELTVSIAGVSHTVKC